MIFEKPLFLFLHMEQLFLPMDLEMDIPKNHVCRVINATVDRLDDKIFDAAYLTFDFTQTLQNVFFIYLSRYIVSQKYRMPTVIR
jgi:hypothetical protein